ncbi:hypothetical protein N8I77_011936 [Diaporthe amygdali]|uniref:Uncharacterized protein n=1 Tax=Phomopsis amygdali TaxID=1214568 RepID=A0AAD9VXM3_PHOAM|nr:hypothetical protein N8I77_011936 [Diaporthe amygdali]
MAEPATTDDVIIKSNNSEANSDANCEEDNTAPFPLSTQEQLQAQALRREAAVAFKHQISQCRLALKYSVIGWTGTLDQEKIPAALSNAPSIRTLDAKMDALERALTPFLPRDSGGQELGPEALRGVERVRERLLGIAPGVKSTKVVGPVLDSIERDARAARVLPPEDMCGWAWSWVFDDWFRWCGRARAWVSATHGARVEFLV